MSASISRVAGALCFNNGDSAEERLREFLAVSTGNELLSLSVCNSLGPVVVRQISTKTMLNFNPAFFIPLFKSYFVVFFVLQSIQSSNCRPKELY